MSDLGKIQRAVGKTLIPAVRAVQSTPPTEAETLPIALELYYTAFAMKAAHQPGGRRIAAQYASRVGLDPDQVEAFALVQLTKVLDANE